MKKNYHLPIYCFGNGPIGYFLKFLWRVEIEFPCQKSPKVATLLQLKDPNIKLGYKYPDF